MIAALSESVQVALVTAGGGVLVALVAALVPLYASRKTRRVIGQQINDLGDVNSSQHAEGQSKIDRLLVGQQEHGHRLDRVERKVDGIGERVAVVEAHVGDQRVGGPGRRLEVVVEPIPPT